MKIVSVDIMLCQSKSIAMSRPVVCRVNTDEGICGYGEAGATFVLGSYAAAAMLREMAPLVIGMDPMQAEVIWNKLYEQCYWTKGNGAILYSAVSALDVAMWDIRGKALGVPVYTLLGGKFRDSLRCYASQLQFGFCDHFEPQYTVEDYRKVSEIAMEKGYDAVKVDLLKFGSKPGARMAETDGYGHFSIETLKLMEARMRAVRESVGPDCEIILEQHCATTLNTAIQTAHTLEPYGIMFMEEPLAPLNPSLTSQLHHATSIPLATGERSYLREGFLPFFQDRSLSLIQPDLGLCGGITEGKKICDMAHAFDIGVQAHVCGTPISIAAGLQLECSIPNFTIHEMHVLNLVPEFLSWSTLDYTPKNGQIRVPDGPGLGIELTDAFFSSAETVTVSADRVS